MRRAQIIGALLVATAALGYASGPLLAKGVYATGTDWLALLAWRFTLAGLLTWGWLVTARGGRAALRRLTARQAAVLIGLGMVFAGNATTYYAAVQLAPVSLVALLLYVYPAIVAVGAMRVGRPFEGRRAWVALGISVVGAALTIDGIETGADPIGIALAAASPVIYAGYILLAGRASGERPGARRASPSAPTAGRASGERPLGSTGAVRGAVSEVPPLLATALMMLGTWLVVAALAVASGERVLPGQIPPAAWPGLIGIAVFATAVAIQAFYAGVSRLGAARAALVSTLEPVFTVSLAVLLLGERLAPLQVLGGALVVAAVLLAQTGRPASIEAVVEREA
ncbi:MAG: DMT family transporter [Chloroflexi bacterium]|nr:DMT family transporter [Chloroflexota bacterium]